jgi:hypothetical protein
MEYIFKDQDSTVIHCLFWITGNITHRKVQQLGHDRHDGHQMTETK